MATWLDEHMFFQNETNMSKLGKEQRLSAEAHRGHERGGDRGNNVREEQRHLRP